MTFKLKKLAQVVALSTLAFTCVQSANAMPTMNNNEKLVIAHRGASGYLPEHTLESKASHSGRKRII